MKFFLKNYIKINFINIDVLTVEFLQKSNSVVFKNNFNKFSDFFLQNGFSIKNKIMLGDILKNFNFLFYSDVDFFKNNYKSVSWIIEDIIEKKLNYIDMFNITVDLIKPPFIIKSVLVPKKLRKKTKQKYLVKIVYKNEEKRLKNSYKQLYYYSNKFSDSKFKVRLYKSLLHSFLDWKTSYLFKLKSIIFKKFLKF